MASSRARWFTAQETAAILDLTSAEVCTLLAIGRLTGTKVKQPGRAGKAQWLVDPRSVAKEKRRAKERAGKQKHAALAG
jgi:hypothetical protein